MSDTTMSQRLLDTFASLVEFKWSWDGGTALLVFMRSKKIYTLSDWVNSEIDVYLEVTNSLQETRDDQKA